ncbi:MAG: DUF1674 domain-containing protein [Rickettsiales bacterium]|nr:DUF1674 domain-containing protein [Rickettsiales bacterium]
MGTRQKPIKKQSTSKLSDKSQLKEKPSRPKATPLDPTRYGDWIKNGRCIDF